jgi:hypothetical protein
VRRGLAVLIVLTLYSLQVHSLAFHVHAVSDHAQAPAHRHGPAIHHHDEFDSDLHVDEGEWSAGGAVITMAVPAATASAAVVVYAEFTEAPQAPELLLVGDTRTIDVRSHGPPPARNAFLRGPPTSTPS